MYILLGIIIWLLIGANTYIFMENRKCKNDVALDATPSIIFCTFAGIFVMVYAIWYCYRDKILFKAKE